MSITYAQNFGLVKKPPIIEIGGMIYPVVRIGTLLWTAKNLDWKFNGCIIGASGSSYSEPRGNYYNNDENTYGENGYKYGLLYNWVAATQIDSLLTDGWRVSTNTDFTTLKSYLENDASKIKSTSVWSPIGTDDFGFNAVPSGHYSYNSSEFSSIFTGCDFWSSTSYSSDRAYDMYLRNGNNSVNQSNDYKADLYSIRLVKDAT